MLAYILAIAVAFGSFAFYMAAFFFPEVHRKYDFLWSGVGFFYAAVLWICAGRITGGVLLGQAASVSLIGWLGWQTLTLRRTTSPAATKTEVPPEVEEKAKKFPASVFSSLLNRFRKPQTPSAPVESVATLVEEEESNIETPSDAVSAEEPVVDTPETEPSPTSSDSDSQEIGVESSQPAEEAATKIEEEAIAPEPDAQPIPPNPPSIEMVEAARSTADKSTAATPVEEFAPEVELAPFAEPPREDE